MRRWCFYPPEVRAALEKLENKIHWVRNLNHDHRRARRRAPKRSA